MTWKLFTFSLFIFTICSKLPIFLHEVLWTPKYKIFTFWRGTDGSFVLPLHFSGSQPVLFKSQISHLWNFNPSLMMIYPCFYDKVVQYRLNHHGYCYEFVSDADWSISLPRIQNFQARKILVSCRENFMLDTRINYIPYEKQVHSRKEWSVFS